MPEKFRETLFVDECTSIRYSYWTENETLILETKEFETFEDIALILKDLNDKHIVRFGDDGQFQLNRIRRIRYY